jgi:hypothetical protein
MYGFGIVIWLHFYTVHAQKAIASFYPTANFANRPAWTKLMEELPPDQPTASADEWRRALEKVVPCCVVLK